MNKKQFTIKIFDKVFESSPDGFLDLNDIHKALNLPKNKAPSQWRDKKVVDKLKHYANMKTARKTTAYNQHNTLVGDEKATVAYAMWVSYDFFSQVLDAFVALRQGNIEEAVMLAAGTMSEEDEYLLVKFAAMKGLCFTKSCWYANIQYPNKFLNYLRCNPNWKYFDENSHGRLFATQEGIDNKITYNCYGDPDSSKVVMRFTQKGRELLRKNSKHFNQKVMSLYDRL